MITRAYLIVFVALTVLFGVAAMLIIPQLDPVTGVVGLIVQFTGVLVIGYLRPPIASLTVLIITMAASWIPTGWQAAYDHQLIIWIPLAASIASSRVIAESSSRLELILGLAPLLVWCIVTVVNTVPSPITVLAGIAPVLAGICFALIIRLRQARKDRLATLEQQRLAADRERLLADLHDLITHRITRVVLRSRQLSAAADQPVVRDGLGEIEQTATETLTALRDYLSAARPIEPTSTDANPRSIADLRAELAEIIATEQRLDRSIRLIADSGDEQTMINSAVHGCAIRAVREALTNVAKHAAGALVTVALAIAEDRLRLSVINDPPDGPDTELGRSGSGTGLRGLASRCHLLGGELTAEPDDHGGFAVRVELPVQPARVGARA